MNQRPQTQGYKAVRERVFTINFLQSCKFVFIFNPHRSRVSDPDFLPLDFKY